MCLIKMVSISTTISFSGCDAASPVVSALGRLRWENSEFEDNLSNADLV